ncbi:hypothetical protein ACP4OV_003373 [Aristida adscensionis]
MPAKRKRRAPAKAQPPAEPQPPGPPGADAPLAERMEWLSTQEYDRRCAAIRAVKAAEAESSLCRVQLLRSYLSEEQQKANALEYFRETIPNLSVVHDEKHDEIALRWNEGDKCITGDVLDDRILRASIASLPAVGGLQFTGDSVGKNIHGHMFGFSDFAWSELPASQMNGASDALQTPGAVSNRLSFGMTPKTVRLPKNGEMLLSVRGSPLGVYDDHLAAIQESGKRSEDAPC